MGGVAAGRKKEEKKIADVRRKGGNKCVGSSEMRDTSGV